MSLIEQLRALPPSEARRELERAETAYIKSHILPAVQAAFAPRCYRLDFIGLEGEGSSKRLLWEEITNDGRSREFCTDYDGLKVLT